MKEVFDHDEYRQKMQNDSEMKLSNITGSCDSSVVYICEAYIEPILLAIGILTNAASLIILPGTKIVQTFKICLIALAISDICATSAGFIQMLVEVIVYDGEMPFGFWEGPAVASYTLYFCHVLFMCVSAGLVVLIVVIRTAIVSRPIRARCFFTRRRTAKLCSSVFVITALLFIPTTLKILSQSCGREMEKQFCVDLLDVIPNLGFIANLYLYMLSVIYGPVLVTVYVASFIGIKISLNNSKKIIRAITQHRSRNRSTGHGSKRKRGSKSARVTHTLLVILVLDTCCTLPQVIQGLGLVLAPKTMTLDNNRCWDVFDAFVEVFLCLRPTYNFWLYCFSHKEFRDHGKFQLAKIKHRVTVRM